jgi:hypothetical protein
MSAHARKQSAHRYEPSAHRKSLRASAHCQLISRLRRDAKRHLQPGVGTRVIKMRGVSAIQRRRESRALASILCAVVLPLALAFVLVALNMRSDLSDLTPAEALPDGTAVLIGWQDLEIPEGKTMSLEQARSQLGRRVRMLGYMMDSHGRMFVLMPEAGYIQPARYRSASAASSGQQET